MPSPSPSDSERTARAASHLPLAARATSALESTAGQRVLAGAAILLLALVLYRYTAGFWFGDKPYYFYDIDFYRRAVVAVMTHAMPMYQAMAYPPFAYLFIWWLPSVPMVVGDQIWTAVTYVAMIGLGFLLTVRILQANGTDWRRSGWKLVALGAVNSAFLLASFPGYNQLTNGQLSVFVAILAFVDVAGFIPKRFRGVLVGLAAAIKVTPMIFGVYYLVIGQWRRAVTSFVSFAGFTAFGALFFPGDTFTFWTKLTSTGQDINPLFFFNLGIRSMLARISPQLGSLTWLWAGLGLALMVVTLWNARRLQRRGQELEAIMIVGAASIIVPPNSLPHYFIWLPMIALWLIETGTTLAKLAGAVIYVIYSVLYFVLIPGLEADNPWSVAGLNTLTLVPILLGVFGMPARAVPDAASRAAPVLAGSL